MLSDYQRSCDNLLKLPDSCAMNTKHKINPYQEMYKTLNNLNPSFTRNTFEISGTT